MAKVIHTWPDEVGKQIDPSLDERYAEEIAELEAMSIAELAARIDAANKHMVCAPGMEPRPDG